MQAVRIRPMGYTPPKITTQVSFRVEVTVKDKLLQVRRAWEAIAKARGDDPEQIDDAHVGRSLLGRVVDEEIADLTSGSSLPELDDEQGWAEFDKAVAKGHAKSKTQR